MSECNDYGIVRPEDATAEGCFVLSKQRAVIATKGQDATVEWQLRDRKGLPIDLSLCTCSDDDDGGVLVRFSNAIHPSSGTIVSDNATIVDAETGTVQIAIPDEIKDCANIYNMQFAVLNCDGQVQHVDTGWLSIERSVYAADLDGLQGPPTLMELRLRLRDTLAENSLIGNVEFSDAELIYAINRPIQQFNEATPPLGYWFTPANFPYHFNWVEGIVANLLKIVSMNMMRNSSSMVAGGVSTSNSEKPGEYLQLAQLLDSQWREFIKDKKVQLNAMQTYGSIGSSY